MKELSIFVDESGSQSGHSRFCLVALLFHDQSDSIDELMSAYELDLSTKGLPDVPFHASPLMNGHDDYEGMLLADIKFRDKCLTETDIKVFGADYQAFKQNHLKRIRRKTL